MKRALVAASVAALLLPVAWTAPAQAVDYCGVAICARDCDDFLMGFENGKYQTVDDAMRACYSDAPVTAAGDVSVASQRSKGSGYTTLNPGRVTAMAKRFVNTPGDVINIHGYGPDRAIALAKAEHVRAHLESEISRLGGDAGNHRVLVTYAGDPVQKKVWMSRSTSTPAPSTRRPLRG